MSFMRLSFDVTNACNLKCVHCLRMDKKDVQHLPIEIFEKALKQSSRYSVNTIIFTGGETFLHPQLMEMIDMVAKAGLNYYLVTNGVRLDKVKELVSDEARRKHLISISISLEGATEETNDAIRGKGVFRKIMATTAFLNSKKIPFGYKQSANTKNCREIEKFVMDAFKLGASYIEYSHMHPTPELVKRGLILPRAKWKEVDQEVSRLHGLIKKEILFCAGGHSRYPFAQCNATQMIDFHIDYKGNLCLCCVLPYYSENDEDKKNVIAGNLAEMDLWDAHKRLVDIIGKLQKSKIQKIANGSLSESDHYPCMYCFKHFGKLNWLKEIDPESEWLKD